MAKVKQPSKKPTRKIVAVILASAITAAAQSAVDLFFPELESALLLEELRYWIQAGIIALAGYMTHDDDRRVP